MEITELTKGAYVIQPNIISRARYNMPTMARRLIFLAVFTVQLTRPLDMKFSMSLHNFALLFGFHKTKRYQQLKRAIDIASKQELQYERENGKLSEWMRWLTICKFENETNIVNIHINERLYDYVLNIRQSAGFSIILLDDCLNLESQYAIRWYEIILSRSGHMKDNYFFVSYTLNEIRTIFAINEKKYSQLCDFKKNIIENPIAEINRKNFGYNITPEYKHTADKITVFLHCRTVKKIGGNNSITAMVNKNILKYYTCYREAKKNLQRGNFKSENSYNAALMQKAIELLKERLGNE
jgi:hypothetical protein